MRRLFPLALLLVACPSKKERVGEPIDASVPPPNGWSLTPEKLDAYVRYQHITLVHDGLETPDAFDGGRLHVWSDDGQPQAHADFDEWARNSNGLSEDDVKRLDDMMGPLTAITVMQLTPSMNGLDQKIAVTLPHLSPQDRDELIANAQAMKVLEHNKQEPTDLTTRYGEQNARLLMARRFDLVHNWLKLMQLKAPVPGIDGK